MDLARRVLQLERANTSLRKEVENERAQLKEYTEKVGGRNQQVELYFHNECFMLQYICVTGTV